MSGTSEIVELKEEVNVKSRGNEKVRKNFMSRQGRVYSIEDDIDRLFESASINKTSVKAEALQKNPMKRPIRANYSLVSGNGRSDSINLKQALRGLCITQASELAAMKKRPVKPLSMNKGKKKLLEISFPDKIIANLAEELPEPVEVSPFAASVGQISIKTTVDKVVPFPSQALSGKYSTLDVNDSVSTAENSPGELPQLDKCRTSMLTSGTYPNSHGVDSKVKEASSASTRLVIPVLLRRNFNKGKAKMESVSTKCTSLAAEGIAGTNLSSKTKTVKLVNKENSVLCKHDKTKEVFSQSSKSSAGEQSSSTSEESSASGFDRCSNRPHMSKDLRWNDIHSVQKKYGFLSLRHFKLLKRLGSGDIGTVYLAELVGSNCLFALKVMDNEFLTQRKKLERAQIEREILQMLDHPFLPTLYTHFTTDKLSCLVMEYCPGGDMHVLRSRQTSRCFPEQATRFYVAEVLLALEYLHMLGIVYRDLKPENILVREDGHIMLTDFDLSLRCVVNPTLVKSSSPTTEPTNKISSSCCSESSCIDPFSLQPSFQVSCFTPRLLTATSKTRKLKSDLTPLPQLIAEPTDARSNSFVGTHEYLAPEIVIGEGHGSAVDWWTYGIFLYELLYGKTPFKGSTNEETLDNVVSESLKFPETPLVSSHAKDLISRLLIKSPGGRLGFVKGATEVKQHPFFDGLNWALIRCASPPEPPRLRDKNKSIGVGSSGHIEFELF